MDKYFAIIAKAASKKDYFLKYGANYYRRFPREATLVVKRQRVLKQNTLLEILDIIRDNGPNRVLLVVHATPYGLMLNVGGTKEYDSKNKWADMANLLIVARIAVAYRKAKAKDPNFEKPAQWRPLFCLLKPSHGYHFSRPKEVVSMMAGEPKPLKFMIDEFDENVQTIGQIPTAAQRKAKAAQFIKTEVLKKYFATIDMYKSDLGLPSRDKLFEYVKALRQVHRSKIRSLEIRGCNLANGEVGKETSQLVAVFFDARKIAAPTVFDQFGQTTPIGGKGFRANLKRDLALVKSRLQQAKRVPANGSSRQIRAGRNRTWHNGWRYRSKKLGSKRDELYFFVTTTGPTSGKMIFHCEHGSVLREFVARKLGRPANGWKSIGLMKPQLVHFMRGNPPRFPFEKKYRSKFYTYANKRKSSLL